MMKKNKQINLSISRESKILIVPINNRETYPVYFSNTLLNLINFTKQVLPNTDLVEVKGCDVNHIRNLAIDFAISNNYDFLVQLDTDHTYPPSFILQLLSHNKDFVTGLTMNRTTPLTLTQFKKITLGKKINRKSNIVKPNGKLVRIEASGPVGMCMSVEALKNVGRPWFKMEYGGEEDNTFDTGGDLHFCKKLKEKGFEVWCDTSLEFPHHNTVEISTKGLHLKGNQKILNYENKNGKIYIPLNKLPKGL